MGLCGRFINTTKAIRDEQKSTVNGHNITGYTFRVYLRTSPLKVKTLIMLVKFRFSSQIQKKYNNKNESL